MGERREERRGERKQGLIQQSVVTVDQLTRARCLPSPSERLVPVLGPRIPKFVKAFSARYPTVPIVARVLQQPVPLATLGSTSLLGPA
jgi:hypothetical protein